MRLARRQLGKTCLRIAAECTCGDLWNRIISGIDMVKPECANSIRQAGARRCDRKILSSGHNDRGLVSHGSPRTGAHFINAAYALNSPLQPVTSGNLWPIPNFVFCGRALKVGARSTGSISSAANCYHRANGAGKSTYCKSSRVIGDFISHISPPHISRVWDEHIVTGVFASPFANPFKKRDQSVIHFHPDGLILRDDFEAPVLRQLARRATHADRAHRLLAFWRDRDKGAS